ncbi:MAG: sigma-70 family RNA polymerase sigma factor [Thermodesulfobacteriota bacterium]
MQPNERLRERLLVEECIAGSRAAWDEFYGRYLLLVRKVIYTHMRCGESDMQDMVQNVFLALLTSLPSYDHQYSLSKFVWVVGERVCIDEYRKSIASKRDGETVPVNHHDHGDEGATMVPSTFEPQEDRMAAAEMVELLRLAFKRLGHKCRELLKLRYLQELPFKEIVLLLGGKEKSLAVQAGRCLDELKAHYDRGPEGGEAREQ